MRSPNHVPGSQISLYKGRSITVGEVITIALIVIFFIVMPFLVGFYRTLYGYAQYGIAAAFSWGFYWFLISFSILILITLYCLYRLVVARFFISVHKSGIHLHRLFKYDQFMHWEDISALYVNQEHSRITKGSLLTSAVILTNKNKKISLRESMIENLPELITQIKSAVYVHLYPTFRDKFRAGELVSFGPVEIQKKYLNIRRYNIKPSSLKIPWSDITSMTIRSGYLLVKLHNNSVYRIRAAKIPNLEILLYLVEDITRD